MPSGKTIVIKYGGAAMQSDELKDGVMNDVASLAAAGNHVVLVHGGGPDLSAFQKKLGKEPRFVDGLRYTDEETIDAALMVLCGKVNKDLVRRIGQSAVGISGIDGGALLCSRRTDPDIGYVGEIREVDTGLLRTLIGAGYIPVVSTIGIGEDGLAYNINADTAAGKIAVSLSADLYVTMTDVPGVLNDLGELIPEIMTSDVEGLIDSGVISGGMIPKARGLADAVQNGVGSALIIDGRAPHAIKELNAGTRFTDG